MSEATKENSSLELYETAYRFHYSEGNIPEACRIYKSLIDEFPNSNECGYAVIQLQKILANDVSDRISAGKTSVGSKIFTAVAVAAFVGLFAFSYASFKKADARTEALSLVSQAFCIMYGGNDGDALELLNKAKTLSRGTLVDPYLLSATICMNMQQYNRARAEFEEYQKISGKSDSLFKKLVTVRVEKPAEAKPDSMALNAPSAISMSEGNPASSPAKNEKIAAQQPGAKQRPRPERLRPPIRPKRQPAGSNPDSASFF
jgi:tetratricopeptide (TPR) repeat protein